MKRRTYDFLDVSDSSEDEATSEIGGALFNEPLFDFNFTLVGPRRRWRNVVERTQYPAELQQLRAPTNDDNIGEYSAGALERAVAEQLMEKQRPDEGFQRVFGSINFRVGELLDNGLRFNMFLQRLARSLNSNESFNSKQGFQVDMVVVRMLNRGARPSKKNPGRVCLDRENLYWRMHHLPPNLIAVEPLQGWRGAQVNQSLKALQWLYYHESLIPKPGACADHIKHVRNGGEQSVSTATDSHFVDGFDPQTLTVYEFHGCLWHGCKKCYPYSRNSLRHNVTPDCISEEKYQATSAKTVELTLAGYNEKEIWKCKWDKMVKEDPSVKASLNGFDLVPPLNPRNAFFGGRTGAVTLHAVADTNKGEEIRYVDVTPFYLWVNKTYQYPVGHPQIITYLGHLNINQYFGVALVDILPPLSCSTPFCRYEVVAN